MHEILNEYDRKIAEIDKRTKRAIRLTFICAVIFIAIVIYFGFFY
jgi:preprotein translocase subunit SecG